MTETDDAARPARRDVDLTTEHGAGRLLLDIAPRVMRMEAHALSRLEIPLTHRQYRILWRTANGANSPTVISKEARISLAAISESVDALRKRDLLTRTLDPVDRRASVLTPTKDGWRALEAAEASLDSLAEQLVQGIATSGEKTLVRLLHVVADNVAEYHRLTKLA